VAVCRVAQLQPDDGHVGVTAIDKQPVSGPVKVRELGLYADVQADRANHGGPNKAVYVYDEDAAQRWADDLGRDVPPGLFGENLRTQGLAVDDAVIGTHWEVGSVLLEVTQPRIPCATFGRRMGQPRWPKRFTQKGLAGAYTRVLQTGQLQAGDVVTVVKEPAHGITVREWFTDPTPERAAALLSASSTGQITLADELAQHVHAAVFRR
jgi:MOSC domain-containing protein YiiM